MALREVGIVINAKDTASKVFDKVSGSVQRTEVNVQSFGQTAESSLSVAEQAVSLLYYSLELAEQAASAFQRTIDDVIDSSLALRKAGDPLVEFFDTARLNSEMLSARIGDVLTPVIVGLGKAVEWNDTTLERYLVTNRKMLSLGIVEFLERTAMTLVDGVGWALQQVTAAWNFMKVTAMDVRAAFAYVFTEMSDSLLVVANQVIAVGKVFSSDMLVSAGESLRDSIRETVDEMKDAGDEANALRTAIEKEQAASEKSIEQRINGIRALVKEGAATTRKVVEEARASERALTQTQIDELAARKAAVISHIDHILAQRLRAIEMEEQQRELQLELSRMATEEHAKMEQQKIQMTEQTAQQITQAMASSFGAAISGAKSAGEAFQDFASSAANIIIQVAIKQISAAAATAAAEAFKSQAGIPIVGPLIGAATAGIVFAAVSAFKSRFAMGGLVTGGIPGQDSVPALLQRGERVLNPQQARAYERAASGGMTQNINLQTTVVTTDLPQRVQRRRLTNNLALSIEEAIRDGRIRIAGAV